MPRITLTAVLATLFVVVGGAMADAGIAHSLVWENSPALAYYSIKSALMLVSVGGVVAGLGLLGMHGLFQRLVLGVGVGVFILQIYYGLFCIPLQNAVPQCLSMVESLLGWPVHVAMYFIPLMILALLPRGAMQR